MMRINDNIIFNDAELNSNLNAIYESHNSPAVVLLEHGGDCRAASGALRSFCEQLPCAFYIEGESLSPYPFLVPCASFLYAIYCAKDRFDNFSHIDPGRVDKIAGVLKMPCCFDSIHPFDSITSFYGFKRYEPSSDSKITIFQQLLNILIFISEKNDIIFHVKNSGFMDEDSVSLINYICRGISNKKIIFALSYDCETSSIASINSRLDPFIFAKFKLSPSAPECMSDLIFNAGAVRQAESSDVEKFDSDMKRWLLNAALKYMYNKNLITYNEISSKYVAVPGVSAAVLLEEAGFFYRPDFAARLLNNLNGFEKDVAGAASIFFGDFRAFDISICLGAGLTETADALDRLETAGILYKTPSGEIYSFANPVLSRVAAGLIGLEKALEYNDRLVDCYKSAVNVLPNIALGRLVYHCMKTGRYADACIFAGQLAYTLCEIGGARRALKLLRYFEIMVFNKKTARFAVGIEEKTFIRLLHAKILILLGRLKAARGILLALENGEHSAMVNVFSGNSESVSLEINKWLGYIYMILDRSPVPGQKDAAAERFMTALNRDISSVENRVKMTNLMALLYYHRSELEKASIFYRDSLKALAVKKSSAHFNIELDSAQRGLSSVYLRQGEFRKALAYLKKCEELCAASGNKKMLSNTYHYIGMLYHSRGEYSAAIYNYEQAMTISAGISDISACSRVQTSLGVTYFNLASYDMALSYFNQSMQVALTTGNKKALAILNGNISRVHAILNNIDAAFMALREDIAILNEIGDLYGKAHAAAYLGDTHYMSGNMEAAAASYHESFEISKKSQFLRPLILSACGIINSVPRHLLASDARGVINELLLIDSREIDIVSRSMILRARCVYETASGTYHRATCFINQALINFEKMNMPLETALCLIDEADIMKLNGLFDMAEARVKQAVEIFKKIGARYYIEKYGSKA